MKTLKVRLLVGISGTRNGQPWPPKGNAVVLPEDEARQMIMAQQAVLCDGPAAKSPPAAERAVVPDRDVEVRTDAKERPLTTATGPVAPRKGSTR